MTDKQLLDLAAKAAGIRIDKSTTGGGGVGNTGFNCLGDAVLDWHNYKTWNPLTNDGDAFDLLTRLNLKLVETYFYHDNERQKPATVSKSGGGMTADVVASFPSYKESFKRYDAKEATRRAIVLAAAKLA